MSSLLSKYRVSLSILAVAILGCGAYMGMQYMKIQDEMKAYNIKNQPPVYPRAQINGGDVNPEAKKEIEKPAKKESEPVESGGKSDLKNPVSENETDKKVP